MRALILVAALAVISVTARADGFPTMSKFETLSASQMAKLPDVRVRLCKPLSKAGLDSRSKLELSLMKNSIFAQVVYKFKDQWYANYFHSRSWYSDAAYHPEKLCSVDNENARMLGDMAAQAKDKASSGDDDGYGYDNDDDDGYGYGYGHGK